MYENTPQDYGYESEGFVAGYDDAKNHRKAQYTLVHLDDRYDHNYPGGYLKGWNQAMTEQMDEAIKAGNLTSAQRKIIDANRKILADNERQMSGRGKKKWWIFKLFS